MHSVASVRSSYLHNAQRELSLQGFRDCW